MNRSTRNNVYDLVIASVYVVGICIMAIFAITICKLVYIIWSY